MLEILKEKSEHTDEDKTFILFLVPLLKKLNDDQKYWAKMEMKVSREQQNMAFHLQCAQCYTVSTSFLNVPSTYENNFLQHNLSTALQIPNNKSV